MPGVRVPRDVHRDPNLRDADVVIYVVLLAMRSDGARTVTAGLEAIAARTGRRERSVGVALERLVIAGHVTRKRSWPSRPYTYRLAPTPSSGFDVVTHPLMRAIASGEVSDGAVRSWLAIDKALGYHGRTRDTAAELAGRRAIGSSTLRAHVDELVALGILEVELRASQRGWSLVDPAVDFAAAEVGSDLALVTEAGVAEGVATRSPDSCGSGVQISDAPYMSLPPEYLTPGSSELGSDRPVSDGESSNGNSGRERPKRKGCSWPTGGVFARPGVMDVLELLDELAPQWTRWDVRRWLGGIAGAVAAVVDAEDGARVKLSPPAAVTAIVELADGMLEDLGGRHVPAVRAALELRARETRQGLACGSCGVPYGWEDRECPWCVDGALMEPLGAVLVRAGLLAARGELVEVEDGALPPLDERLAAYRHLGVPADEIRDGDPEAAAILDAERAPAGGRLCGRRTALGLPLPRPLLELARPARRRASRTGVRSHRAVWVRCAPAPGRAGDRTPLEHRARPPPRCRRGNC